MAFGKFTNDQSGLMVQSESVLTVSREGKLLTLKTGDMLQAGDVIQNTNNRPVDLLLKGLGGNQAHSQIKLKPDAAVQLAQAGADQQIDVAPSG